MDINRTVRVTLSVEDITNLLEGNTVYGDGIEIDFSTGWRDRNEYELKVKDSGDLSVKITACECYYDQQPCTCTSAF